MAIREKLLDPNTGYFLNFCGEAGTVALIMIGLWQYRKQNGLQVKAKIHWIRKMPLSEIARLRRK